MEKQLQLDLKGWLMLFLVSLMWGGSFLFVEVALRELPPITIVMARVSLAAVVCYLFMKVSSQVLPRTIALWKSFFVLGLLNNVVPFTLLVWGQQ
ncbi:MAG: DMT family transporter, partial [Kordiimonadaceae bacterium]|nr:DMT family transporter [Kordiimonadaceae bacterium]